MNCFAKVYKFFVSFIFDNKLLKQYHSCESWINIFTIVRRGGRGSKSYDRNYHRGKCLQLWTAPKSEHVDNYGWPLSSFINMLVNIYLKMQLDVDSKPSLTHWNWPKVICKGHMLVKIQNLEMQLDVDSKPAIKPWNWPKVIAVLKNAKVIRIGQPEFWSSNFCPACRDWPIWILV